MNSLMFILRSAINSFKKKPLRYYMVTVKYVKGMPMFMYPTRQPNEDSKTSVFGASFDKVDIAKFLRVPIEYVEEVDKEFHDRFNS